MDKETHNNFCIHMYKCSFPYGFWSVPQTDAAQGTHKPWELSSASISHFAAHLGLESFHLRFPNLSNIPL